VERWVASTAMKPCSSSASPLSHQPRWRKRAGGQHGHVARQIGTAAQLHKAAFDAHRPVLQHRNVALLEQGHDAVLNSGCAMGSGGALNAHQGDGGLGQALAHCKCNFNAARAPRQ
jgi:hypothetical protein